MRKLLIVAGCALCLAAPVGAVSIDWVTVGDPGNPADTEVMNDGTTGYGSVPYTYQIGKYAVTNAQYTEFLNAVAATDTNALYNGGMGSGFGGITQNGSSGSFTYQVIEGRGDMPVNFVTFYDSLRFANWLHNGQPMGGQDGATTEDGAYTFSGATSVGPRNAGATIFLTSEDEWYKAAYFDGASYFDYPVGTDTQTLCALPGADPNTANCGSVVGDLTDVGSYTGSSSPYGTFDQGGNVWEWNEAIIDSTRGLRGGRFSHKPKYLEATSRNRLDPIDDKDFVGLRVAAIPEPGVGLLVMTGILGLAAWRRRST